MGAACSGAEAAEGADPFPSSPQPRRQDPQPIPPLGDTGQRAADSRRARRRANRVVEGGRQVAARGRSLISNAGQTAFDHLDRWGWIEWYGRRILAWPEDDRQSVTSRSSARDSSGRLNSPGSRPASSACRT
eukprot:6611531-Prymnesium_polylepis.1